MNQIYLEVTGHIAAVLVFTAVAFYTWRYRTNLRRNVQRSRFLYHLLLVTGIVFSLLNLARLALLFDPFASSQLVTWFDLLSVYPSIIALSIIIFYMLANKIIIERTGRPTRILAIGAHPDDFDVAAGATLARLYASGSLVSGLILSNSSPDREALSPPPTWQANDFLGLSELRVLDFEAGCLHEQPDRLKKAIARTIEEVKPHLVLTHSMHDRNSDHRAVHEASLDVGCELQAILCYESPSATQEFSPALFVDVGEYVSVKTEALERNQYGDVKPYLNPESVRGLLAYRGGQAKVEYAEGFEVVRLLSSLLVDL